MRLPLRYWRVLQAILFQLIWLIAVIGNNEWLWLSCICFAIHLAFTPCISVDLILLPLGFIGFCVDMAFYQLGLYSFQEWPYWLLILWFGFVLNFGHSFHFLSRFSTKSLSLIGAIGGCYAYLISWKLGAVDLPLGIFVSGIIIAACWAFLFPLLEKSERFIRGLGDA